MMKVLQIVGLGAKKFGGLERYMLELAYQLQVQGGQLLLVFETNPVSQLYVNELANTNAKWVVIPYAAGKIDFAKEIAKLIDTYKPEIVHTNFSNNIFISLIVAKWKGSKNTFHTEHCMPVIVGIKQYVIYQILSALTKKIFGVSQAIVASMKNEAKINNAEALYLGVEDVSYNKQACKIKYGIPTNKIIIANIAYHNPVKGVDVLLRAVRFLRYELGVENFIVCQIGGGQMGQDTEVLHRMAKELKIESHIKWMGIQNSVSEILAAADIYCQPSRSEGIPLSIMEASFAKLPTVATRVGGISEAARDGKSAILVENEDDMAVAKALQKLINSSQLRQQMGNEARLIAMENFTLKKQVAKLINEYSLWLK